MASSTELAYEVSLTLGDHAGDYDIDAIVADVITANDGSFPSRLDDIDSETYWAIVERHDNTAEPKTCEGHTDEDAVLTSGVSIGDTVYCDGSCQS